MKLPIRYILTAGLISLAAFVVAASVTVYFWLSASWGVGIFLITMLPIIFHAGIGGFFLDPTKTKDGIASDDAPRLKDRIKGMTLPLILASIPFGLILVSWHNPTSRALVVQAGGAFNVVHVAENGLTDRSSVVALEACEAIEKTGPARSRDLMVKRLFVAEDETLVACLLHGLPSELDGRASMELQAVAARWERGLWEERVDPERACRLADHLRQAERSGADLATPRLLGCSVGAPDQVARQCCAQSLRTSMAGAPSVAAILPPPDRALETSGIVERLDLIISAPRAADPDIRATLGLDQPEFRAWSLSLGCSSFRIWRNDVRERAGTAMADALGDTCEVAPPTESTVGIWNQTCAETSTTLDPAQMDDAICEGLNRRFVMESIALARRDVTRAHRIANTPRQTSSLFEQMLQLGALAGQLESGAFFPKGSQLDQLKIIQDDPESFPRGDPATLEAVMMLMNADGKSQFDPEMLQKLLRPDN